MLTRTAELGIAIMSQLASAYPDEATLPVRLLAERLGSSPSYTTKVVHLLTRERLTRTWRGAPGGVSLAREPRLISLLEIIEACQGKFLADFAYCPVEVSQICGYHRAMLELHRLVTNLLTHWTLADLTQGTRHKCSLNCLTSIAATGRSQHMPNGPVALPGGKVDG